MNTPRVRVSRLVGSAFAAILVLAPAVRAGVNTWTGGRAAQEPLSWLERPRMLAADPRDPYVVYAVFQPDLYKSRDGGRSWTKIAPFSDVLAILVHPASPDDLYVSAYVGPEGEEYSIWRSSDAGQTWVRKVVPLSIPGAIDVFAGSPTDADTVYAGTRFQIIKSTDGGESWSNGASVSAVIASLVVSPRDPQVIYCGTDTDFYYYPFAAFGRSVDGGATLTTTELGVLDRVSAIAVDPDMDSRVFVGLSGNMSVSETGIRRSDDDGDTFSRANNGLHVGASVSSLVIDPANTSTLYAGTDSGVYRSRDSGARWSAIGQILSGVAIDSLAIASGGRRIHAGTASGVFGLDIVSGPIDVAAAPGGGARVLRWDSDRLAVQTVDGSDNWTATPYSEASATWTAVAIASDADGVARVLWQNGDGRSSLETVGLSGGGSSVLFERSTNGFPADVAAGPDASVRLLRMKAVGTMHIETVQSDGVIQVGPLYESTPGWTAIAIDVAPDGRSWVLWRSADGRAALSVHVDGTIVTTLKWGATPDWSVEDVGIGSDGRARVLATTVGGSMQVWTVAEDGTRSVGATHESTGLVPRRIAAGADGLTRVLWGGEHGEGEVWFLDSSGNHVAVAVPVLP